MGDDTGIEVRPRRLAIHPGSGRPPAQAARHAGLIHAGMRAENHARLSSPRARLSYPSWIDGPDANGFERTLIARRDGSRTVRPRNGLNCTIRKSHLNASPLCVRHCILLAA
ncbi:hypothetical protein EMEDMD4_150107 [Sinorhizobium medicae]|uniref:Uncharacterized protein n=1 Tax=Sinorhizobium medicae TaxID=110321 RepID=A0A508WWC4_9HYPH|nr:hypothetical protein EMEDMD4_150107 [Sinorhizobium medicae]